MLVRNSMTALALALAVTVPAHAQEALVTYKSMSPEVALELARASLEECRKRGFQAAIAVVDRFGVTQVMLRDRFAGAHTPSTAAGKAWTAVSFRTNTSELVAQTQRPLALGAGQDVDELAVQGHGDCLPQAPKRETRGFRCYDSLR